MNMTNKCAVCKIHISNNSNYLRCCDEFVCTVTCSEKRLYSIKKYDPNLKNSYTWSENEIIRKEYAYTPFEYKKNNDIDLQFIFDDDDDKTQPIIITNPSGIELLMGWIGAACAIGAARFYITK